MTNIPYLTTGGICIKYNHSQQKIIENIKKYFTVKHSTKYRNRIELKYVCKELYLSEYNPTKMTDLYDRIFNKKK